MVCKYCKVDKNESDFYPRSRLKCKSCTIKSQLQDKYKKRRQLYQKKYYSEWYRKNGRNRSDDYQEVILQWQRDHPEAVKAKLLLRDAVRVDKIIKPKICSVCNKRKRLSGHHDDYSKPLEVKWLCSSCHKLIHLNST